MGKAKETDGSTTKPKSAEGAASLKITKEKPSAQGTNNSTTNKGSRTLSSKQKTDRTSESSRSKKPMKMSTSGSRSSSANSTTKVPSSGKSLGNGKPALPPINSSNKPGENNANNPAESNGAVENNNTKNSQAVSTELVKGLIELGNDAECRVFELMTQIMLRHGAHCNNCGYNLQNAAECTDQVCPECVACET